MGSDDRCQIPFLHVIGKNTLNRLAHDRVKAVKGLVTEQILCPRTNSAENGNLLFHALGKGIDLAVFLKSEAL